MATVTMSCLCVCLCVHAYVHVCMQGSYLLDLPEKYLCACMCTRICIICVNRLSDLYKSLETIRKQVTDKLSEVENARRDLVEIEHKEGRQE